MIRAAYGSQGEAALRLLVGPHDHRPVDEKLLVRPLADEVRKELLGKALI